MQVLLVGLVNDKVCHNRPCTEDGLKESIQNAVLSILLAEFQYTVNMFLVCDAWL
jgi:hypothetical protein